MSSILSGYRWGVTVNGKPRPEELTVTDDELFEGGQVHTNMGFALKKGDKLRVALYGMDKPAYLFWKALVNQQNSTGSPFDSTPANAPGNISNGAVGFFGASSVTIIEREVK